MDEETELYYYGARYYDPRTSVFLGVYPMAEKYPGISPFTYCKNNPVNVIDPNGMEVYYLSDGACFWQLDDNEDISVIDAQMNANNARAHFESGSGDAISALMGGSVVFADYFTNVSDVTNGGAAVVPYSGNCYNAAEKQIGKEGYGVEGSRAKSTIFTKVENGKNGAGNEQNPNNLSENTVGGAIKVTTDLKNGKPVMVGVYQTDKNGNYNHQTDNTNPLTSHFVVINSASSNGGVVNFNYLDNARGSDPLSVNLSNGAISGRITGRDIVKNYTVSEVRNSWTIRR